MKYGRKPKRLSSLTENLNQGNMDELQGQVANAHVDRSVGSHQWLGKLGCTGKA